MATNPFDRRRPCRARRLPDRLDGPSGHRLACRSQVAVSGTCHSSMVDPLGTRAGVLLAVARRHRSGILPEHRLAVPHAEAGPSVAFGLWPSPPPLPATSPELPTSTEICSTSGNSIRSNRWRRGPRSGRGETRFIWMPSRPSKSSSSNPGSRTAAPGFGGIVISNPCTRTHSIPFLGQPGFGVARLNGFEILRARARERKSNPTPLLEGYEPDGSRSGRGSGRRPARDPESREGPPYASSGSPAGVLRQGIDLRSFSGPPPCDRLRTARLRPPRATIHRRSGRGRNSSASSFIRSRSST